MTDKTTLARPYAKAIFKIALEYDKAQKLNSLSEWAEILRVCGDVIRDQKVLKFIKNKIVLSNYKVELLLSIVNEIIKKYNKKIITQSNNLISILAKNNKLDLIPDIYTLYNNFKLQHERILRVKITTANDLDKDSKIKIQNFLKIRLNRELKLEISKDEKIISGFVAKVNDQVIDSSIKGRLLELEKTLKG